MLPVGNLDKLIASKNMGYFAAICLIFNQLTGPGLPTAPSDFQNPGWVMACMGYIFFAIVGGFSSLFLVEAIQAVPGNRFFQGRIEYATLINFYFGYYSHLFGQFLLYGANQSIAIQSIILTAQSTDNIIALLFGQTCGLTFEGSWICVHSSNSNQSASPFGETFVIFTIGFLAIMSLSFLMGVANFDGNVGINIATFIITLFLAAQWASAGFLSGVNSTQVPPAADISPAYGEFFGTVMLNMGLVLVIPSWINAKRRDVSVQKVVWTVCGLAAAFFISFGFILAHSVNMENSKNVLDNLLDSGVPPLLTRITVCLFAYTMLLPSIPLYFIISRENLVHNNVLSKPVATFVTFVLPWIMAIPLQTRSYLYYFQDWTSLVFMSTTNFILPFILYFKCVAFRKAFNSERLLSRHQLKVLQSIHAESAKIRKYIARKSKKMSTTNPNTVNRLGEEVDDENDTRTNSVNNVALEGSPNVRASPAPRMPPVIVVTRATDIPVEDDDDGDVSLPKVSNASTRPSSDAHQSRQAQLLAPVYLMDDDEDQPSSHSDIQDWTSFVSFKQNGGSNAEYIDPLESGLPLGVIEYDVPDPDNDVTSFYTHSRARTPSSIEMFGAPDDRVPMQQIRPSGEVLFPVSGTIVRVGSSCSLAKENDERRSDSRSRLSSIIVPRTSGPDTIHIMHEGHEIMPRHSKEEDGIIAASPTSQQNLDVPVFDGSRSPSLFSIASGRPSDVTQISGQSFPRDPEFYCPAFRVVPVWIPINEQMLAYYIVCFSSLMTVFSICWTIIDHIYESSIASS